MIGVSAGAVIIRTSSEARIFLPYCRYSEVLTVIAPGQQIYQRALLGVIPISGLAHTICLTSRLSFPLGSELFTVIAFPCPYSSYLLGLPSPRLQYPLELEA